MVLVADGEVIEVTDADGEPAEAAACVGDVGRIENRGDAAGRWVGEEGYDTGILEPGDGVTLVFREPMTIGWRVAHTGPASESASGGDGDADNDDPVVLAFEVTDC